jgi:ubiquinone biosynthesis monooxygenase Coq7
MTHDAYQIRTALSPEEIRFRGQELTGPDRRKVRSALRTLHNLEIMAVNIYRYQATRKRSELNRRLISAMANEMTHVQDFQTRLLEYGMRPSIWRWISWIAGCKIGILSRILGRKVILKTGVWVEEKAVHHYGALLEAAPWDDETLAMIRKDRSDEMAHIRHWKELLGKD